MKMLRRTEWYNAKTQDGKTESNVMGRFVEKVVPDIFKSKQKDKVVLRKQVTCEIKVSGSEVKDMVSHEILEKDNKSNALKKRFADAWKRFEKIKSIAPDPDAETDDGEISAQEPEEAPKEKK